MIESNIKIELRKDLNPIREAIEAAKDYLKIITFRFSSKNIAEQLIKKSKEGVNVRVITTPPDNIAKEELRPKVRKMFDHLRKNGIDLLECAWEVGEPRLTPTSLSGALAAGIGEKWYSLHFQMILNEREVLITSKNLAEEDTLDIYYKSNLPGFLKLASEKFDLVYDLFFKEVNVKGVSVPGSVLKFTDIPTCQETLQFFQESRRWKVKHYALDRLPKGELRWGLYLCPFEGKMRDFLYALIDSAEEYLYLFVETFFDEKLVEKLEEKMESTPSVKIKIITSPPERIRQNKQKAREMIKSLISLGAEVAFLENIQGKFWVNDKWVVIPSGDLNKMNLGYSTGKNYWRADTQLVVIDDSDRLVNKVKDEFEKRFQLIDAGMLYKKDVVDIIRRISRRHGLVSTTEAKNYLARLKAYLMIKTERDLRYIVNLAVKITRIYNRRRIEGLFIIMAIILYYLQRREQKMEELLEKLETIEKEDKIRDALNKLVFLGFVVKSEDIYRINVEKML